MVAESGTVEIEDGRLYYEIMGDGEPIALALPQSTGPDARCAFLAALARKHRIITYDQRGTGRSSPAGSSMSMASQGADLLSLLRALGLSGASLLCHSTGCGIGLSVAEMAPGEVKRLMLISPWTHADRHLTVMQNLRVAAARSLEPTDYAHFNAALLFPPEYRRAERDGFERMAAQAVNQPQNPEEIATRLDAILAFDARPMLSGLRTETLIMAAGDDQLMPVWFAEDMANRIPDARYVALSGGGHMLPETRTEAVVAAVARFIEGVDPRAE